MDGSADSALVREVAGVIAWWRDAGVDLCFDDEPAQWISPAQPTALEAERQRIELRAAVPLDDRREADPSGWTVGAAGRAATRASTPRTDAADLSAMPGDLASFSSWWTSEPSLDGGRTGGRVPPRGPAGAALMVLVPEPEADDDARLLTGPQGRLLGAILAAAGLGDEVVYVASALPRHMPMPDWTDLAERGFGEALARHVALVAPQRLVAFGSGVLSLLGNSLANIAPVTTVFAHGETQLPLLRARGLEAILARPAWKAELWNGLLDWMPSAADRANEGAGV